MRLISYYQYEGGRIECKSKKLDWVGVTVLFDLVELVGLGSKFCEGVESLANP